MKIWKQLRATFKSNNGKARPFTRKNTPGAGQPDMASERLSPRRRESASARILLGRCAQVAVDGGVAGASNIWLDDSSWSLLVERAEAHHLAPLLCEYLRQWPPEPPPRTRLQLRALRLRHEAFHRARTRAIRETLAALEDEDIRPLVLKGAALAWMIYPCPIQRPMGDIDLLAPPGQAARMQATLRRLGFDTPPSHRRFGTNKHHLPIASRSDNGLKISVEVHRDALSRNIPESLTVNSLSESPRPFALDDRTAYTLGHVDMLRHLCHHALEPAHDGLIRLISVVDMLRYSCLFINQIDWERIKREYPFVLNTMKCIHYVVPLPGALHAVIPPPEVPSPAGAGETVQSLNTLIQCGLSYGTILKELFKPPVWWLHAAYAKSPESSLYSVRFIRHPMRVARWFAVRVSGY